MQKTPATAVRNYPDIGAVTYRVSSRASRVRIQVKPRSGITVTLPQGVAMERAEGFFLSKKEWVLKSLEKTGKVEARRTIFHPELFYSTREHRLKMIAEDRTDIFSRLSAGEILVRYPGLLSAEDPLVQEGVRLAIIRALTREAMVYLPARITKLEMQTGLKAARISVRNNRSRWGSCAANGNISLNIHLMRLPDELIDYIILHELAHTVHRNHGPGFHKLLEEIFPDHREAEKRLRRYSPSVF